MKRFWKKVDIEKRGDSLAVTLDTRPLKTPLGTPLFVPSSKDLLATLIAAEWDHQTTLIKPHALPMVSNPPLYLRHSPTSSDCRPRWRQGRLMACQTRLLVLKFKRRCSITSTPTQYGMLPRLRTCKDIRHIFSFWEDSTPQLERLQAEHWDPLFEWVEKTFAVQLSKNTSILFNEQPRDTRVKLGNVLKNFDQWQMAGEISGRFLSEGLDSVFYFVAMERATYTTKSFIIALALVFRSLTPEQAALAASVEVNSQIERWGEVEDSTNGFINSRDLC